MTRIQISSNSENHDPTYLSRLANIRKAIDEVAEEIPSVVGWKFDMDNPQWQIEFMLSNFGCGVFSPTGELADDYPLLFKILKVIVNDEIELEFRTTGG